MYSALGIVHVHFIPMDKVRRKANSICGGCVGLEVNLSARASLRYVRLRRVFSRAVVGLRILMLS
jgi:hypothetical protein